MGMCWSKKCVKCDGSCTFMQTEVRLYDGLEWFVDTYKCNVCSHLEREYRRTDQKAW